MNNIPSFLPKAVEIPDFLMDVSKWDVALDEFDKKKYLDAFYALLDYVSPEIRKKYGDASQHSFSIPHGSIVVNIEIKDDTLFINAPFIQLPEKNIVPLLRQVAQLNFSPLNLAQIELKNDVMEFNYQCKLYDCEPYKIYYTLKEICHNGDRYDDDFTDRFSAVHVHTPDIKRYDENLLNTIWAQVSAYIEEAKQYLDYFDGKRLYYFSLDILSITFRKIDYYANPQGSVRNIIERTIADIENQKSNATLNDKISYGKQQLFKLLDDGKEKFLKDIYHSEIFIPYKYRGTENNIKENFAKPLENAAKELGNNDYTAAALTCMYNFTNMYYYNNVPKNIDRLVSKTLIDVSQKTWKDAASVLCNTLKQIVEGNIPPTEDARKKKGFLASLFGN